MPFKSKAQQRYMFATMPHTAKKWAKETDFDDLPDKKESIDSEMPKLEDVYCLTDPRHDEEDAWEPEVDEVWVSQHQAHLVDDDDLDPLGTGKVHDKRPLKFGAASMSVSNTGV